MLTGTQIWDQSAGRFVSQEHQRIAEVINDWDENYFLAWVPPELRNNDDTQPFAILERNPQGKLVVIRRLKEDEVNHNLIAWLWSNDTTRHDVLYRLELQEKALKALELKKEMDTREEMAEFAQTVLKSPLHTFKHDGKTYV